MFRNITLPVILYCRQHFLEIPLPIGQMLAYIPYSWRPGVGRIYRLQKKVLADFETWTPAEKKLFILKRMKLLTEFSYNKIRFYKDFYRKNNFSPESLSSFDDINRIPIISKSDLLEYSLEDRSDLTRPHYLVNTGGSSGNTLGFFHSQEELGHEWASVHYFWDKQCRFKPWHLKLGFSSKGNMKEGVMYDVCRHTIQLDLYREFAEISEKLKKILSGNPVYFLHGYPSVLYELALYCKEKDQELQMLLRKSLKGAFLCSEHPFPLFRDMIEEVFHIKTFAFYGHTERCVCAFEMKPFVYNVLQAYGYTEAVKESGNRYSLVGTSYYNFSSPLIRYNTNDYICNPVLEDGGLLQTFEIQEGRKGDFVIDQNGKSISLTGLIFGKHHELFNYCSHLQVSQREKGKLLVLYTPKNEYADLTEIQAGQLFSSSNIKMDFSFKKVDAPFKTAMGKILLKVPVEMLSADCSKNAVQNEKRA